VSYEQVEPTETGWSKWEIWPRKFRHMCCHCSEVHDVETKVDKKRRIWFRWKANNRASAAARRNFLMLALFLLVGCTSKPEQVLYNYDLAYPSRLDANHL